MEPTAIEWPYVRTLVCVETLRNTKKGRSEPERHYYISSLEQKERSHADWLRLIRNHWGGVEIRNHWRKDACWGEDRTRSRNRNIVGALALLRNALLAVAYDHLDTYGSLPAFSEACEHDTSFALRLIRGKL
jgi:hypothetical protein